MQEERSVTTAIKVKRPYGDLSRDELEDRLSVAEDVCVMFGWSAYHEDTDRDVATYKLWRRWTDTVGDEFLKPKNHPHLNDEAAKELAESASYHRWLSTFVGSEA